MYQENHGSVAKGAIISLFIPSLIVWFIAFIAEVKLTRRGAGIVALVKVGVGVIGFILIILLSGDAMDAIIENIQNFLGGF